jgi:exodeoxyribonuclease VII small subunit
VSGEQTFEQAQKELDEIVGRLERGDVPIDDAIALWRRGEELYGRCVSLLDTAEGRIDELSQDSE